MLVELCFLCVAGPLRCVVVCCCSFSCALVVDVIGCLLLCGVRCMMLVACCCCVCGLCWLLVVVGCRFLYGGVC